MTTPAIDTVDVQRYLDLLYPDPPADAWLVVSWFAAKNDFRSRWFRMDQYADAVAFIRVLSQVFMHTPVRSALRL